MRKTVITIIFGLFFLFACTSEPTETQDVVEEIKIGVLSPITGPLPHFAEDLKESYELAIDEFNQKHTDKKIKLIYEDTKCIDLKATTTALKKLKEVDDVVAVLGPFCGGTNVVTGEFSKNNDLFVISPGDNFDKQSNYKFNTRYLIKKESELLAEYALKQNWTKIGIIHYNNEWGQAYRDNVRRVVENAGGEIVGAEAYTFDDLNVRTSLLKSVENGAEALFILDGTQGELFEQVIELGIKLPIITEWEIELASPERNKNIFNGAVYFLPVGEETDFHKKFIERYGEQQINMVHVDAYDAAKILTLALEACEDYSIDCMADYIKSLENYQGAGGKLTFNPDTWSFEKPFIAKTVKNGEFVNLEEATE